ncbi:hypothetical protein QR680_018244 [Steinernema hermaphroditum]|uniref:Band 7 domain-containing protein n=1 Tax=Steinernema hermaphroditum TaxID=289476 RepID=A0AA39HJM7_9BILA|nr:hypothetical protein QR680_018244 [Steinernema hermaphroditum]
MSSVHSARNSIVSLVSSNDPHSHVGSRSVQTKLVDEGAMLPSSSSKDEDILSDSSDEIENIAMQTLEHLHEPQPQVHRKSLASNQSLDSGIRSKRESKADVSIASKKSKKANGEVSKGDIEEKEEAEKEANIQNEFGICGWILTILSYILIFFTLPISACMCIKVVQEYERAVIFRLGRLMPGGAKGPGIFFIVPCIDTYRKVDLRVLSFEVPPQEILSKDSVTVAVDAVVYFRISNATISVTNVEDSSRSTKLLAQTTLRNILGTKTLAEMLSDREAISLQMQSTLDEATEPWGVKVERVEVKDVRLPVQLQRAMAAEAEAAREARAKVIVAEGEQKASRALKEAAEVIAESPSALQLRYLQTLNSISAEKNSTIIFPFPIDLLSSFLQRAPPKVEEPPPLPKKIRSCCLYKYPDWVQNMVGSNGAGSSGHHHHHGGSPTAAAGGFPSSTTSTGGRPPLPVSMREAEYQAPPGSSLSSSVPPLYPQTHSPSVGSPNRSALSPRPSTSQRSTRPPAPSSSLLKQALANRMGDKKKSIGASPPEPLSKTNALDGTSTLSSERAIPSSDDDQKSVQERSVKKTDSAEMNSSVLANPAWYRDHDGRTGYIPEDYEHPKNEQKSQIKMLGPKEEEKGKLLECFGSKKEKESELKQTSPKQKRKSSKERRDEDEKGNTDVTRMDQEDGAKSSRKSSKERRRLPDEEGEHDSSPSSRERSESPSKSSKKKRDDSAEGKQKSKESLIGKLFKRNSSKSSDLDKLQGEDNGEAAQDTKSKSKKSRKSSKERSTESSESLNSPQNIHGSTKADKDESSTDSGRSSEASASTAAQKFKDLEVRRSSTQLEVPTNLRKSRKPSSPSSEQVSPRIRSDSRRESMDSRITIDSQNDAFQGSARRPSQVEMSPRHALPAITIQADTPQNETVSRADSQVSNTGRYSAMTSERPPLPSTVKARPKLQDVQQSSTDSSVEPGYGAVSGIRKIPPSSSSAHSTTSEELHRRDSSQSESSRFSNATHKSVTFSDHIVVTEIERKEREVEDERSSSSDEEASSIVSARPIQKRRKKSEEEGAVPGYSDGYHSEEVSRSRQDDYALKYDSDESNTVHYNYNYEVQSASSSSSGDVDSGVLEQTEAHMTRAILPGTLQGAQSLQSVYREDELGPDMYQMELNLDLLPEKVREAVLQELMEGGYSGQDINVPLSGSMTRLHAEDSRPPSVSSLHGFPRSASGYLDNPNLPPVHPQYPQSQPPQPTAIEESFYDNVPSTSQNPQPQHEQPTSPAHLKPPTGRPKAPIRFTAKLESGGQGSSSSASPESPIGESEMRKKFIALYGNRRAPIASDSDECPKDPAPSERRDSVSGFSTDSWESIVSATSMKAESKLRRYFNY